MMLCLYVFSDRHCLASNIGDQTLRKSKKVIYLTNHKQLIIKQKNITTEDRVLEKNISLHLT